MDESVNRTSYTERVFAVLEALAEVGEPIGPRPLARHADIDRNAVSRILQHLAEIGIVERNDGEYVIGSRLFALSRASINVDTFTNAAQPIIARLASEFQESVYVCRRAGDVAFMTHSAESERPVRYVIRMNTPFPIYAGSAGAAILSGLPDAEIDEYLARVELKPITHRTMTEPAAIRERVRRSRDAGFAFASGEVVVDGWAVSAPYFNAEGVCVGCLVLSAPSGRMVEDIEAVGSQIRAAAEELSARLGHRVH